MEGIENVVEMEKEAEKCYRELAGLEKNPGLRSIFMLLAEEEARHHNFYSQLAKGGKAEMEPGDLISSVKKVFLKMKEARDASTTEVSEIDFYRKALQTEKEHYEYYQKKADDSKNARDKEIFLLIAGEEERHARVLEMIVDFVSRPDEWLEDAEWYHLDEY